MSKLKSIRITTIYHVDEMRKIYNDNLDTLATMPLPYRSFDEQQKWWNDNSNILEGYLYKDSNSCNYFAFSLLTNRGNFKTPIIAIKKDYWGNGYGKEIIIDYINKACSPLAGSQLKSNGAICHLNKKLGWEIVGEALQPTGIIDLLYHPGIDKSKSTNDVRSEIINYLEKKYK